MPESLGARLRRRREEQHIALSTIAERTKIKASLLEALERDDVSQWPAGIYRRAFIRSYAAAVALDPDLIVREFLELYPDPEEAIAETAPPPSGFRGVVGLALGSLARLGRGAGPEPAASRGSLNLQPPATRESPAPEIALDVHDEDAMTEIAHDPTVADAPPVDVPAPAPPAVVPNSPAAPVFPLNLPATASICTAFARVESGEDLPPLLARIAATLGARGLIVWLWDPILDGLRPALAHGYSPKMVLQLPTVRRDEDNATAAAFRQAEPCAIDGTEEASGAVVVPLMAQTGASGVLAIELPHGWEREPSVLAIATIFAAMLSPLVCSPRASQPEPAEEPVEPAAPLLPVARTTGRR